MAIINIYKTIKTIKSLIHYIRGWFIRIYINSLGGRCGRRLKVGHGFYFKHPPHKGIVIGNNVTIGKNTALDVPFGAQLILGDHVKLNMDIVIAASQHIEIGEWSQVAEFTSIRDADHGLARNKLIALQELNSSPVIIGKDVWIGRGVAILKGATISDGSVIGANSVVKGKTHTYSILVGAPAKPIKSRV